MEHFSLSYLPLALRLATEIKHRTPLPRPQIKVIRVTRPPQTWRQPVARRPPLTLHPAGLTPVSPPRRNNTARMNLRLRQGIRPATISRSMTRAATTTLRTSNPFTLPNRRLRYQSTSSPTAPAPTISGLLDIGILILPWAITGFRERGYLLHTSEPFGRRDTGATWAAATAGTTGIGALTSASTAASTMATATSEPVTKVVIGIVAPSTTTAPSLE